MSKAQHHDVDEAMFPGHLVSEFFVAEELYADVDHSVGHRAPTQGVHQHKGDAAVMLDERLGKRQLKRETSTGVTAC